MLNGKLDELRHEVGIIALPRATSDHVPLLLTVGKQIKLKAPFRLFLSWWDRPNLPDLIQKWRSEEDPDVFPSYCL